MVTLKILAGILAGAVLTLTGMLAELSTLSNKPAEYAFGGVNTANSYQGTTTSAISGFPSVGTICSGSGELGEITVVASGSAGGAWDFYNATTTNVFLRTGQRPTSTILVASIPSNATVGTYQFNRAFSSLGLIGVLTGTHGTTTVSYRCI